MYVFHILYECYHLNISIYYQPALSPLLVEITTVKTISQKNRRRGMWPVPGRRIVILVVVETCDLHWTVLFLCSVDDAFHGTRWLAWPGSESSLSNKWKLQTGSLKSWPLFYMDMIITFFTVPNRPFPSKIFHCSGWGYFRFGMPWPSLLLPYH